MCLEVLFGAPARSAVPVGKSWEYILTMADASRGLLEVSMTLRGHSGDVELCLFMPDTEPFVSDLQRRSPGPAIVFDDDCWQVKAVQPQGLSISYKFDLRALADRKGAVDYADRTGGTYLWNDQAVLLHPIPYPRPSDPKQRPIIDVEFHLPPELKLVTPWTRVGGPSAAPRFRFDSDQHDGGSYILMGTAIDDLGTLSVGGVVAQLHMLSLPHRTTTAALRTWLTQALGAVKTFYGDNLSRTVSIILIPVSGSTEPGIFGTVVRRGVPSVVIFFGGDCTAPLMKDDWVAIHELFHLGNPIFTHRVPWFGEGFTTYYQDILRVRARVLTAEQAWEDLHDGFRRFCQPERGVSLAAESREMQSTHRYRRVYWGGACLAFIADAAIRERSHGQRSLDAVMIQLRQKSLETPIDEATIVAALDEATGDHLISKLLHTKRAIPFTDWYKRLGIEPIGSESVRFLDSAPLAPLRKAMLQ